MTTHYLCPIGSCAWFHVRTDPDPAALAPWQGDLESTIGETLRREVTAIDAALRAHCETHPLIEWVAEVQRERIRADATEKLLAERTAAALEPTGTNTAAYAAAGGRRRPPHHRQTGRLMIHPPWCDRALCTAPATTPTKPDKSGSRHRSALLSRAGDRPEIYLSRTVQPWETSTFLHVGDHQIWLPHDSPLVLAILMHANELMIQYPDLMAEVWAAHAPGGQADGQGITPHNAAYADYRHGRKP